MPATNIPLPAKPGAYVLIIRLDETQIIDVGRLGEIEFPAGFYAYVGSALNGISARVGRHLRRRKKRRWHVDYLTEAASVSNVVVAISAERLECQIASGLKSQGLPSTKGFGCSDCKCPSHLFHHTNAVDLTTSVMAAFHEAGMLPILSSGPLVAEQGAANPNSPRRRPHAV